MTLVECRATRGSIEGADTARMVFARLLAVYPRLAPHQKIFVVPGTFACSNLSYLLRNIPISLFQV